MYAAANPSSAPVTGDAFNSMMCEYSKLEATKLKYAGHIGFYAEDCNVVPTPTPMFILIEATVRRCSLTPGWEQLTPRSLSTLETEI